MGTEKMAQGPPFYISASELEFPITFFLQVSVAWTKATNALVGRLRASVITPDGYYVIAVKAARPSVTANHFNQTVSVTLEW